MVRVKICGLRTSEEVKLTAKAGGDAVGAVVNVPDSPRNTDPLHARKLFAAAPPFVYTVAVTMPKTVEEVVAVYETAMPDALQIHGVHSPSMLGHIRDSVPCKIIVTFSLGAEGTRSEDSFRVPEGMVKAAMEHADAILADTYLFGGSGIKSDWSVVRKIRKLLSPKPLILAGGLTPDNVAEAVRSVKPFAVDVSSGVELKPGVKDPDLIRLFISRAKGADGI